MMKGVYPLKTLQMIIRNEWLVDSIVSLGSGFTSHLAYQNKDIEPEVLDDIRANRFGEEQLGEVIHLSPIGGRRIAKVEIAKANDFETFVRFDFRLLEVRPFLRNGLIAMEPQYLCYYGKNPA
ncbi:MAG TPA: hypothetical protein PL004_00190 [Bacillota bacterium]|nr:hypothetical protein [Bacillota bacterium]